MEFNCSLLNFVLVPINVDKFAGTKPNIYSMVS
jgi:hypothetical protein